MKIKFFIILFLFYILSLICFSDFKIEMYENKQSKYDSGTYHLFLIDDNVTVSYTYPRARDSEENRVWRSA